MSDSVRPHRRQPARLPGPWDSPGKNTGVGCHFLLQCMKMKGESEVPQSCPTVCDPMDCSLPGSSIRGLFQARVLEWGAIAFSRIQYEETTIQGCRAWFVIIRIILLLYCICIHRLVSIIALLFSSKVYNIFHVAVNFRSISFRNCFCSNRLRPG